MVDTSKKSNRKCEYCDNWVNHKCKLTGAAKWYWNCCKHFQWRAEFTTPEYVALSQRLKVEKLEKALAKKDKEIEGLITQYRKAIEDRKSTYHEMVLASREFYDTKNTKVGDTLYYIDYEISGSTYTITKETTIEGCEAIKDGEYFIVLPSGDNKRYGYVRIEEVNRKRFFTTPERAHEAYLESTPIEN